MTYVYLDIETTGLDWLTHDVVEIAWAVDDGDIKAFTPEHTLQNADPRALELNGYFERELAWSTGHHSVASYELLTELRGATVVGSNPAFDTAFLRRKLGVAVWHHRLFDVSAYAAGLFGGDKLNGLAIIAEELRDRGYSIDEPDHTARQDVHVLRQVHKALLEIAGHGWAR